MATNNEIEKALTLLAATYPNFKLPSPTIQAYQRLLADMDFDLLKAATLHCATMCKFFPTVAEIRSAAVELQAAAEGIPSADEAWGDVIDEIRNVGHVRPPTFKHPLVLEVVNRLGWRNLCLSENSIADRARFMDAFTEELQKRKGQTQMLPEVRNIIQKRSLSVDPAKQIAAVAKKLDGNQEP